MKTTLTLTLMAIVIGLALSWSLPAPAEIMNPTRIVVLPFYVEEGVTNKEAGADSRHYRRMMKFINNQLVRHHFEVINPFAADLKESEYNKFMQRAREDSPLAAQEMTRKYATDVAYIVWLKVKLEHTPDGYCKVKARVEGEGYDSGSRDLGVGLLKSFIVTRDNCDDAIVAAEKEVGDKVGRVLTAWGGAPKRATVVSTTTVGSSPAGAAGRSGGGLQRKADALEGLINVRLDSATDYATVEVFGKVLNTARGVVEAKNYRIRIEPDNPQASVSIWRAHVQGTDSFRLQANINKMLHDITNAGGEITLRGVPYRYSAAEVDMLKGIRTGEATSREVQFVVDRELARDREMQGLYDPYEARERAGRLPADPGFE